MGHTRETRVGQTRWDTLMYCVHRLINNDFKIFIQNDNM